MPIVEPEALPRASDFFNVREDRISLTRPDKKWFADIMAKPIAPFDIPNKILATVSSTSPKITGGTIDVLAHLTGFPYELCALILTHLTYRDLVLLCLTSKSMAIPILADPIYTKLAAAEEAEHNALGHLKTVISAFPQRSHHRSKLWCSHYTCPFHMRRLRGWNRAVGEMMMRLKAEPEAEGKDQLIKEATSGTSTI
ncbi:hypothetical protein H2200_011654 [Cladophialophora chaetospira]|uniref:F-box domain-containing protein n=1 Tax=Cladophialophora chaetospira TaxID=386627 RepID=A0AA39CDC7_9EURO|nr:hypothetical protein H2200_011654 [Cladophialophora chaetospira]